MSDQNIYVERLRACRKAVEAVPGDNINMYDVVGRVPGCGCALYHFGLSGGITDFSFLGDDAENLLFSITRDNYPIPTGQPAKDEFLRRIDEVIAVKLKAAVPGSPLPDSLMGPLNLAALELGYANVIRCNDSGFPNAHKMVLRAIELAA